MSYNETRRGLADNCNPQAERCNPSWSFHFDGTNSDDMTGPVNLRATVRWTEQRTRRYW
jgi:hypothetical protein